LTLAELVRRFLSAFRDGLSAQRAHFRASRSFRRLFTAMGICGIHLEDRQFSVFVYLVDVPILDSLFTALMGVRLFVDLAVERLSRFFFHRFDGCPAFQLFRPTLSWVSSFPALLGVQLFTFSPCFRGDCVGSCVGFE